MKLHTKLTYIPGFNNMWNFVVKFWDNIKMIGDKKIVVNIFYEEETIKTKDKTPKFRMTYIITSKGRFGYISPVPTGKLAATLLKYMSYERLGKQFMANPAWATVKLYSVKTGRFPWGLLHIVEKIFQTFYAANLVDDYKIQQKSLHRPLKNRNPNSKTRDYQRDAIKELIEHEGGILCMPTGSGKTFTILEYLRIMNKKTVVIVPSLDLVTQWNDDITEKDDITVINYQNKKALELVKAADIVVVDECISGLSKIKLADGTQKEMKEIYNDKNITHVLSYNENKKIFESKKIIKKMKSPLKESWFKIIIKDSNNNIHELLATKNHKIWTKSGYKRVDELNKTDVLKVYLEPIKYKCKYCHEYFDNHSAKIIEIKEIKNAGKRFKYNLEVEDNHNYIANNILISNCHYISAKSVYALVMKASHDAITIGCSATPYRNDNEDMKIFAGVGPIVYKIDKQILVDQGYLVDAEVRYVKYPGIVDSFAKSYAEIYEDGIVNNPERNTKILKIIGLELRKNKKILILINRIEHGEELYKKLSSLKIIYLHGGVKDRDINFDDYDIIIATTIWDEGINLPSFDTLILGGGGKSTVKLIQRAGRVLRPYKDKKKAIIYDFMDKGKYLTGHYKQRRKLLEQEFEKVIEID